MDTNTTATVDTADETKAEKFQRVGAKRVNAILDALRKLENCAGAGYEHSEDQIGTIEGVLYATVERVIESLRNGKTTNGSSFTL